MGVQDGQAVSAAVTNPAFLDSDSDDTALGKITFNNISDVATSGPAVVNIQREVNGLFSWTGRPSGAVYNSTPTWGNVQVGTSTDSLFARSNAITGLFDGTTGHRHDGTNGGGPLLSGSSIQNVPLAGYFLEGTDLSAVTGSSSNITSQMTGKSASTGSAVLGVVTTAPFNKTVLRYASGTNTNGQILDISERVVYGRVTYDGSSVWTLSYFVDIAGVETTYTFATATDVRWYYQELFSPLVSTPIYSEIAVIPSDNATADILDATETQAGKVLLANTAPPAVASASAKGTNTRVAHQDHTHEGVHALLIDGNVTQGLGDVTLKAGNNISLSWSSGKIQIDQTVTQTLRVEYHTVNSTEALSKSITLAHTPVDSTQVVLDIKGVGPQFYTDDFSVSGAAISWTGLGMDSLPIEAGDKFRIVYWS
jgi:hypothetical protein